MQVNDYDLVKAKQYLSLNHQLVFSHIIAVGRRNDAIKREFNKKK